MKKYVRYLLVLLMCGSLTGVKAQTTFSFDGIRYCLDGREAQVFNGRYYSESKLIIPNSVWYNGIKYPVTSIRHHAFYECKRLTEVTIPNSITTIEGKPFENCTGLQKVIWNARNVQDFQDVFLQPFSECDRLTDFVFGEEVEHIPNYVCYQLTSLKKLVIGNSVTTIGKFAFTGCTGLTEVTIPNSVTTIGDEAFDGCTGLQKVIWTARNAQDCQDSSHPFSGCNQLTDFVFGEEVKHIPAYLCYYFRLLNTIVIPNSVTSIGTNAFSFCIGLTEVTIPNSVTTIGDEAFNSCNGLKTVTIGNSVTTIGSGAFDSCTGLQKVTIGI